MMTLRQFAQAPETMPAAAGWYLADLGEALGKQRLFTHQAPQKLIALREHAIVESAVSSNRLEGVTVEQSRVRPVVIGKSPLKDRNEEEVRGYGEALKLIHESHANLSITEESIRRLHRIARSDVWDAGRYKQRDADIIERYPNGRVRIRFRPVAAHETPTAMAALVDLWDRACKERWVHPAIALAAFNLDFVCIHPFRDGNGRVSRLLWLLQSYHLGYEVGRYVSLERIVEENKERYYQTLEQSSQHWHEGRHDRWPYMLFVLSTLRSAYGEFQQQVGRVKTPRGIKTSLVQQAVDRTTGEFSLTDLQRACPGVSRELIRRVLRSLQQQKRVECLGRGPGARWRKRGTTSKRG